MAERLWGIRRYLVEIKIGTFFLVGLLLFFIALLSVREATFFKGTYPIKVKFEFAEGLRTASPVRFCGVDVGEVRRVEVEDNGISPVVYVHAKIQKSIRLPRNAYFFVNSLSLFGEKYLEITPPEKIEGYLKEGEVVEGLSPTPLFNVFATFHKTMKEVSLFVKEGKLKTTLENSLMNMEQATLEFKNVLQAVNDQEGTIGRLFYDDSLYQGTKEFIEDLKAHPWKLLHKPKEKN